MKINVVSIDAILRCPKQSLHPQHYRSDGTCRCVDNEASLAAKAELRSAQAELQKARQRVAELRRKVDES